MKSRIIKTSYWQDKKIHNLSKDARHFFVYLITCPYACLTSYFQINENYILIETAYTKQEIDKSKKELQTYGRAYFYEDWVFIPKMDEHNRYNVGAKTGMAYQKELSSIPKRIIDCFNTLIDTSMIPTDTPRNHKPEIINNNTNNIIDTKLSNITDSKEPDNTVTKKSIEPDGKELLEYFSTNKPKLDDMEYKDKHKYLYRYWNFFFKKRFNADYSWNKVDFTLLDGLIKKNPASQTLRAMDYAFANGDWHIRQNGCSIKTLSYRYNELLSTKGGVYAQ